MPPSKRNKTSNAAAAPAAAPNAGGGAPVAAGAIQGVHAAPAAAAVCSFILCLDESMIKWLDWRTQQRYGTTGGGAACL